MPTTAMYVTKMLITFFIILNTTVVSVGVALARGVGGPNSSAAFESDVAVAWLDLTYEVIQRERLSPPVASRVIGYVGIALYEAVVAGMPGHRSLADQLTGLGALPPTEPNRKYHWPTVANAVLASVLRGLLPNASTASLEQIATREREFTPEPSAAPPPVSRRSVAHGQRLAEAILAWAGNDGYTEFNDCPYVPPVGAGLWEPTAPGFAPALQPCWGRLRPVVDVSPCSPLSHPPFSTAPDSAFLREAVEVHEVTQRLTPEQVAIALFWADNPGETGTPAGHWISIVGRVAKARGLTLDVAAEAYARVGIAAATAFISCWDTKYRYNLLRPVTYIRSNIDPAWTPPLITPPFPEFTSGHSVQSAAIATVLADQLGDGPFVDDTHAARGLPLRSFTSFTEAAAEAAVSRLYGGIHYRSAIDIGLGQGRCIGLRILEAIRFREHRP